MKEQTCVKCGEPYEDGKSYCTNCGAYKPRPKAVAPVKAEAPAEAAAPAKEEAPAAATAKEAAPAAAPAAAQKKNSSTGLIVFGIAVVLVICAVILFGK